MLCFKTTIEKSMSAKTDGSGSGEELLRVFRESEDPVLTAVEVGEKLGITQQAAHARLSRAHDRGEVERKKTGSRSVVWWLADQDFSSE